MKTYLECLHEAAAIKDFWRVAELTESFDDGDKDLLQKAADIYASQSNSHKHGVSGKRQDAYYDLFCRLNERIEVKEDEFEELIRMWLHKQDKAKQIQLYQAAGVPTRSDGKAGD